MLKRVHQLVIKTADLSLTQRIRFLLEDAFKIASFPNIPPNAQTFIKQLYLKNISINHTSMQLSQLIDHELLDIDKRLIQWPNLNVNDASSVWFKDELSAYELLLKAVVNQQKANAWYWKLVLKQWSQQLSEEEAYDLILTQLMYDEKGWLAIARVTHFMLKNNDASTMLSKVTKEQAEKWLSIKKSQSFLQVDLVNRVNQLIANENHPQATINNKNQHQKISVDSNVVDVKNVEIKSVKTKAIDIKNSEQNKQPINTDSFKLISSQWQQLLNHYFAIWQHDDPRMVWILHIVGQIYQPSSPGDFALALCQSHPNVFQCLKQSSTPINHAQSNTHQSNINQVENVMNEQAGTKQSSKKIVDTLSLNKPQLIFSSDNQVANLNHKNKSKKTLSPLKENIVFDETKSSKTQFDRLDYDSQFYTHELSDFAGFPLIIQVMSLLGMGRFIENNQRLHWLPAALLNEIRLHLKVSQDDCAFLWVPYLENSKFYTDCKKNNYDFSTPKLWHVLLKGKAEMICEPIKGQVIVNYWLIAIARFVRFYAKINIRQLIFRCGKISITPTHVDVVFNLNQIDINIRAAGIDINPGWVSWLGRVINIHYQED